MFYDKFAALCKQKGVSVSRAAIESGISKSLVTKWKTNKVDVPSPEVLQKLSTYFNMTVSALLEEDIKIEPTVSDGFSDVKRDLIRFAEGLTNEQAALALRVLKSIVEGE